MCYDHYYPLHSAYYKETTNLPVSPTRTPPPYPEVNIEQLKQSANSFQPLLGDANKIVREFSNNDDFAYKIKDAAQHSQTDDIKQYITEIGINRPVEIKFNPDSIRLKLVNETNNIKCCKLTISLRW
ncbi:hypothetical protein [Aquibacillus saliphilus]|uniref:hypothetical protein n=1 Tax=Aquibacillus saliphilus TaxID=1909422 RepID=UPI001CEFFB1B|nr:hypothetical protein [Aquibacillus saliphilus]